MVTMFDAMNSTVTHELDTLKKREEEHGVDDGIDYGEVFTDFAT